MRQNKYDKRESKYRAWFIEREEVFKKHFLSSGLLITTWSAVTGELDKIDKRYGLSDDNREVWNVLWNKIFCKPDNHINPKHDRQRRCKKVSTRVHCDRNGEVKDIRDRLENE